MNPITSHYTTDIDHLRLFLFTTDALLAKQAEQVGIDSIIVDWERIGKRERQISYSTQINADTPEAKYRTKIVGNEENPDD